jgi:acyl-CoA thioester hydrolase
MSTDVETFRGVAYPWLCDSMGHMNTQHYCALFDGASFHFLALVSPFRQMSRIHRGWADVKQTIEYKKEVRSGDLLVIRTAMIAIGRSSITYCHTMNDVESGNLRATSQHVVAHFDLANRVSVPLTDEITAAARRYVNAEAKPDPH